jgi:O-antigen/teichoic acid export membrane protein
MTLAAAGGFLGLGDLGLGYGVMNTVAAANGRNDRDEAGRIVSNAFLLLCTVALLVGVVFAVCFPWIPWARVLAAPAGQSAREVGPAVLAFSACVLFGLPLTLVQHVQAAYQESYRSSIWQGLGTLTSAILILVGTRARAPLWMLVLASSGSPVLANLLNGVELVLFRKAWLRPRFKHVARAKGFSLLRTGSLFLLIQMSALLAFQSDSLILAWRLGPRSVVEYGLASSLFMMIPALMGMALMPLWPAYSEALVRGDIAWTRTALWKSTFVSAAGGMILCLALWIVARPLIALWTRSAVMPGAVLLGSFAIWAWLNCLGGPLAIFVNGAGGVAFLAPFAILMAIVNVALSWFLTGRIGAAGVVVGSLVAQVLLGLPPPIWFIRRQFRTRRESKGISSPACVPD